MKKNKIIKLTELTVIIKPGWAFLNPPTRIMEDYELETYVDINKISSFTRINPVNEKLSIFNSIIYDVTKPKNIDLKPYTYLEIVGGQNIKVKETPEEIKKLIES